MENNKKVGFIGAGYMGAGMVKNLLKYFDVSIIAHKNRKPIDELKKIGEAKLKVLFWDVYNSSLYSKTGKYEEEQFPQALKINYLIDTINIIKINFYLNY